MSWGGPSTCFVAPEGAGDPGPRRAGRRASSLPAVPGGAASGSPGAFWSQREPPHHHAHCGEVQMAVVFERRRHLGDLAVKDLRRLAAHAVSREAVASMERLDVVGRRLAKQHRLRLLLVDGREQAAPPPIRLRGRSAGTADWWTGAVSPRRASRPTAAGRHPSPRGPAGRRGRARRQVGQSIPWRLCSAVTQSYGG